LRSSGIFLRRLKAEVLPELPKVIRQIVPLDVDLSPVLEELSEYLAGLMGFNPANPPFAIDPTRIPFELIAAIRRETGSLKVEAATRFILEETADSPEKVVVFAHHHDVLTHLAVALPGSVKVTGESSMKNRRKAVDDFQGNPKVKYFVASIQAAGVGITLTAGARVIFVEQDWTPAMMEQAEARLSRIGQVSSVLSQYLVVHDSIDEKIANALAHKQEIITQIIEK
jgi:SWI/SNF-related matrix-associated actin-dependent regulator 1 of chromatin subfamily A